MDGGAPFYNVYKAKDGVFYAVGCVEPKFYRNFMRLVREMGGLTDPEFLELEGNQMAQDDWPQHKTVLQKWFSKHKSKALDKQFAGKDCCVDRVLTEEKALESLLLQPQIVKGKQAQKHMSPIWKELIKEC